MNRCQLSPFLAVVLMLACGGSPETPTGAEAGGSSGEAGSGGSRAEGGDASTPNVEAGGDAGAGHGNTAGDEGGEGGAAAGASGAGGDGVSEPFCGNGVVDGEEECDDQNATARDGCEDDCKFSHNVVFVTSTMQRPDQLGGAEGADALCEDLAASAGLPGHYVAWLSTSTEAAPERLGSARGWLRVDGRPFADTVEQLVSGQPWYPIALDENGTELGNAMVVTATDGEGAADAETCDDWSGNSENSVGGGDPRATAGMWSGYVSGNCDDEDWRLYCFGVDFENPFTPPSATGRRVFVSSGYLPSGDGTQAADDLCQVDADAAGLNGTFKALLATEASSAVSRLSSTAGPFVRTDGVVVTTNALGEDELMAPMNVTADGQNFAGNEIVWSGALDALSAANATSCSDWGSTAGKGLGGIAGSAHAWFYGYNTDCSFEYGRLYCVED